MFHGHSEKKTKLYIQTNTYFRQVHLYNNILPNTIIRMTGGQIQLAARGQQDIYLTGEPQITFFKIVYRRHTNFSTQPMIQKFVQTPDFGKKVNCVISRNGDLMGQIYVVFKLPKIKKFISNGTDTDSITKFAWVRKIGLALIKSIEIEIGGQVIDKHYGEWLNIWFELTERRSYAFRHMIGDVEELTSFTNGKEPQTLYIPLQFWFCRSNGLALPLVSLIYSEVRINLEINDFDRCYTITPTHYITLENDIVNFKQFEYIEQTIDGVTAAGLYTHYDDLTKRLYYMKISRAQFQSYTLANENTVTPLDRRQLVYSDTYSKYWIRGLQSDEFAMPRFNSTPLAYTYTKLKNVMLEDCYLLVEYIWIDSDERIKFADSRHDYLIEQLQFINEKSIDSSNRNIRLDLIHPAKLLAWVVQYSYLIDKNNNDHFNYTDDYKYSKEGKPLGKSLIKNETIILNGLDRVSYREYNYFNYLHPYQHTSYPCNEGINILSLSLYPTKTISSGSCNMTQIDNIEQRLNMGPNISVNNSVKYRGYQLGHNILRIINGLAGVVFTR
jgi:hypothetical protein